ARRQRARRRAALLVALHPHLAAARDLDLQPLAERVHHRDADAVQTAGDLVGRVLEFAAGVEDRQHDLGRRFPRLLVRVNRDTAAVVTDRDRPVGVQNDLDRIAVTSQRLVHRVVDGLVHEVVQTVGPGVADVHGGALADRLQALEDLDVTRGIRFARHAAAIPPASTTQRAAPLTASGSGEVRNTCSALWISCSTLPRTSGSSSESASSSSSTGEVPAASLTGNTSASRSARASSLCWPREPNVRASTASISSPRSSRCGPTTVCPRRSSSPRARSRAATRAAGSVASPIPLRYAT